MEVDVPQSSNGAPVVFDQTAYENGAYDILEEGVVVAPATPPQPRAVVPQTTYYPQDRYEQLSNSWTRPNLAIRKMKSKLFRSPPHEQPAQVLHVEAAVPDQAFLDETSRAVSSVNQNPTEEDVDEERVTKIKYRPHFPQIECQPSTSQEPEPSRRGRPLNRLTLQIGKKVLRFKVADANPIAPVFQDVSGKFRCTSCRVAFRTHDDYQMHNKGFHSLHKQYFCVVCGTGFTNKAALTIHHKIHKSFKSHECTICHKVFSRAANLLQHLKMHQTGRHHFCEICGRCFKEVDQMMEHQAHCISVKNGEIGNLGKPLRYQCGYCDKLFHHKRDKFIHERIHTGEKPYQCGYCGRGFTQSQALTIHIRNHTGERPFSCSYCPKQFKDSSSLRKHEFRAHIQADFLDYDESSKMDAGVVEEEYDSSIWK